MLPGAEQLGRTNTAVAAIDEREIEADCEENAHGTSTHQAIAEQQIPDLPMACALLRIRHKLHWVFS